MEQLRIETKISSEGGRFNSAYRPLGVLSGVAMVSLALYALNRARVDSGWRTLPTLGTAGAFLLAGAGLTGYLLVSNQRSGDSAAVLTGSKGGESSARTSDDSRSGMTKEQLEQSLNEWFNDPLVTGDKSHACFLIRNAFSDRQQSAKLSLYGCQLNSLPSVIWRFTWLTELCIGENQLTSIPKEIQQLKNLKILTAYWNQLEDLPEEIGELQKLESLYISNNKFKSIPTAVKKLANLKELFMCVNSIDTLPGWIGTLKKLEHINIIENPIESEDRLFDWFEKVFPEGQEVLIYAYPGNVRITGKRSI